MMTPTKLMLMRRTILLLCLLGHYSALTVSQNITITGGFFAANEAVSVVAADPTATTVVGTRILTITFEGVSAIGTQVGSITEIFVLGPSTAAWTEELSGLSQTDACVLTRSLSQGSCFFVSTALNTDSGSIWTTAFETYTLASNDFRLQASYIVTAGQEKLPIPTATTTNSAPSTSSALSSSSGSLPIPPPTGNHSSNSSAVSATYMAPTAMLTPPAMPTANRATIRYDTQYCSSTIVVLAIAVMVAVF